MGKEQKKCMKCIYWGKSCVCTEKYKEVYVKHGMVFTPSEFSCKRFKNKRRN